MAALARIRAPATGRSFPLGARADSGQALGVSVWRARVECTRAATSHTPRAEIPHGCVGVSGFYVHSCRPDITPGHLSHMKSLQLMSSVFALLLEQGLLIPSAQRVEYKRTRSGHWRLYVVPAVNVTPKHMAPVMELVDGTGVTCNPFGRGGLITGVTFVADEEAGDPNAEPVTN